MDRRDFLKQAALWSAGAAIGGPVFDVRGELAAAPPVADPILSVARGTDYTALVSRVLKPLGGIGAFVKKNARVVVKPNIAWDRTPEQGANTHPDVVKAVVQLALDAGAKRVMVFDRPCHDTRRTYERSGIQAAVESLGDRRVRCRYIDDSRFTPVRIRNGKSLDEFAFYKDALEPACDCYINVPVAKHHSLAKLTLALKNVMGVIGGNRGAIHRDIGTRLSDLNLVIRPQLNIIDATRMLMRHGPTGGNLEDVQVADTLVASADIVAADAYATTLFDRKPEEIPATVAAAEAGLGQMDLGKVRLIEA